VTDSTATDASTGAPIGTAVRPDLGQALGTLLRAYLQQATTAVADLPGGPRGYQLLATASSGRCANQAGIAASIGIDRTVMTYLVDDLEKAGLVERRPDPVDRRARQVLLTAAGEATLAEATARLAEVESAVLAGLDADEVATFRRLLDRVTADGSPADHAACAGPPAC
jgi:DNA-binding MarR family transcriptional regulator